MLNKNYLIAEERAELKKRILDEKRSELRKKADVLFPEVKRPTLLNCEFDDQIPHSRAII